MAILVMSIFRPSIVNLGLFSLLYMNKMKIYICLYTDVHISVICIFIGWLVRWYVTYNYGQAFNCRSIIWQQQHLLHDGILKCLLSFLFIIFKTEYQKF